MSKLEGFSNDVSYYLWHFNAIVIHSFTISE